MLLADKSYHLLYQIDQQYQEDGIIMKLISWNVNARVKDGLKQVRALAQQAPHLVALQDVRVTAVKQYEQAFAEIGLPYVLHTLQDTFPEPTPTGVLIASCFRLERLPLLPPSALWPEGQWSPDQALMLKHWSRRTLFVTVHSLWGPIGLYNTYITPASHEENLPTGRRRYPWIKWDLLSGVYHALAIPTDQLRILCGDFNTPRKEKPTGEIITWGYDYNKAKDAYRLTRLDQDRAERRVLQGLATYNLPDAYRLLHGYANEQGAKGSSWKNYRYDHIFASQALAAQSVTYLDTLYSQGLSDHVPIEAVFAPQASLQQSKCTHQCVQNRT